MNKRRLIFFSIFGAYQVFAFIFTLLIQYNTSLLFKMVSYISWFKYGTFFGIMLLVVDAIWWMRESKSIQKNEEASRHENNTLKAKVYDLQEASKVKPITNSNS
jgi:hypothetical protein